MANDPIEVSEPTPIKKPFDVNVRWPKYIARINESVATAEQHLYVPAGTISSIPREPDFVAVAKTYAIIEPLLNQLIVARLPHNAPSFAGPPQAPVEQTTIEGFRTFVAALNMFGNAGKLQLADGLGLLTKDQADFIRGVAMIRNRYAHNVENMHRSLNDILSEERQKNARIVQHVTGLLQVTLPDHPFRENGLFKMFMYHRLADYLADALDTLRPPPLPWPHELLSMQEGS
ncbi:MAG TPA: hypothetical protein VEW46_18785 [Pyrinomonadaceae bacterium]|nr:hypothetical protein [Pyrinomonadaceae bacterium]